MSGFYDDEEVLLDISPSRWHYAKWYLAFLLGALLIQHPIPLLLVLLVEANRKSTKYIVTNKRLIKKTTFINNKVDTLNCNLITNISINQHIIQRVLRIGHVQVNTSGSEINNLVFENSPKPERLAEIIQKAHSDSLMSVRKV